MSINERGDEGGLAYEGSGCGCHMPSLARTTPAVDIACVSILAILTVSRRVTRPYLAIRMRVEPR